MLKHLSVQNYALIDKLEIDFPGGLIIITGETGAGKSILMGALSLLLGERADIQLLQDKNKKCIVEAAFGIKAYSLQDIFSRNELDYDDNTTIRREINPEGKSRAFVNDTPVNLSVLKELGEKLIDVHSQHETLNLNESVSQLSAVDAFAKNLSLLEEYRAAYGQYRKMQQHLNELLEKEEQSKKEQDYYRFQFNELEEAKLGSISQEDMEQELEMLDNAETIKSSLSKAEYLLDNSEEGLLQGISQIRSLINPYAKLNRELAQLADRLNSSYIELKDIATELSGMQHTIHYDAARVNELNEKLDALYHLEQKHRVSTVAELVRIKNETGQLLEGISSLEAQIKNVQHEISILEKSLLDKAQELSKKRKEALPKIEKEISKQLVSLGMPDGKLEARSEKSEMLSPSGLDKITFLFSANKGSAPKELNKVASGGELSRLMLSIKSLIAKSMRLPAIIFDEIDAGVSGEVADRVGSIMESLGQTMQVIAITHLPQIASKGTSHFYVYKEVRNGKTFTRIKLLDGSERVKEIAKMLSTENPTEAAMKNAKELLG